MEAMKLEIMTMQDACDLLESPARIVVNLSVAQNVCRRSEMREILFRAFGVLCDEVKFYDEDSMFSLGLRGSGM
jgi:hypothetical protein